MIIKVSKTFRIFLTDCTSHRFRYQYIYLSRYLDQKTAKGTSSVSESSCHLILPV